MQPSSARSDRAKALWQSPDYRRAYDAGMARSRAVRSEKMRALWQDPEYRAKRPHLLPPMTKAQRRLYTKMRENGANRDDALRVVMGEKS